MKAARLVVNPGSAEAWEVGLEPGVYTVGRSAEASISIEHPSISNLHCELRLSANGARLRDLGSTNGSFITGELVEEADLEPGQAFRLGSVELRLENDVSAEPALGEPTGLAAPQPDGASAPGAPKASRTSGPASCKFHPRRPARFLCSQCGQAYCDFCVSTRFEQGVARTYCRACGATCLPVGPRPTVAERAATAGFGGRIGSAFLYPFNGDGAMLLLAASGLVAFLNIITYFALLAGILGLVVIVAGGAYFIAYIKNIVASSAAGDATMPDWPDFTGLDSESVVPLMQFIGVAVVSFLPALLVRMAVPAGQPWRQLGLWAAILLGCGYFPMAFLALCMFDTVTAVNPLLILPSIARIPLQYALTVVLLGLTVAAREEANHLLLIGLPAGFLFILLRAVVSNLLGLYLLIVDLRILGLMYSTNKQRLGWFKSR